ncbi:MAG: tetratricopeptide repeat protein [Caldimonas sp.]
MKTCRRWLGGLMLALCVGVASAAPMTRAQALVALSQVDADARVNGIGRLAEIGAMADAERVLQRLGDDDPRVREAAAAAVWQIWSRSGDAAIDKLFARGLEQIQSASFDDALATFSQIVRRKPGFAEGWNKRATVYFLMGRQKASLMDCDEVFKRNPHHFGALAGAGQIHLQMGDKRRALEFFRRAVDVNPTLDGAAQIIPLLEEQLADDDKHRT